MSDHDETSYESELREMAGYRSANDQGLGVISADEIETTGNFTPTDLYQGETDERPDLQEDSEDLAFYTTDNLREGETDDVMEAIEGGLTYVPPIDPPVTPDNDRSDELEVVNGFALSADDESDHPQASLATQVMLRLRNDAATVELATRVQVRQRPNGVIELSGVISDLTDEDMLVGVAEQVEGVEEVRSRLEVGNL